MASDSSLRFAYDAIWLFIPITFALNSRLSPSLFLEEAEDDIVDGKCFDPTPTVDEPLQRMCVAPGNYEIGDFPVFHPVGNSYFGEIFHQLDLKYIKILLKSCENIIYIQVVLSVPREIKRIEKIFMILKKKRVLQTYENAYGGETATHLHLVCTSDGLGAAASI